MKTIILMERGLTFFLLLFFINSTTIFAQDYDYYYLEVKEGYDLGEVSKTITPDQTLILSMGNTEIATILNQKVVFDFKKVKCLYKYLLLIKLDFKIIFFNNFLFLLNAHIFVSVLPISPIKYILFF